MLRPALVAVASALLLVALPPPDVAMGRTHSGVPSAGVGALATDAVVVPAGASVSPLAAGTVLHLAFTLPFSNGSSLGTLLAEVENPASPEYRHFLSYSGFEQRFGPSPTSLRRVEEELSSSGATGVSVAPGGLTIEATLDAAQVEQLLGVHLVRYLAPGDEGFTAVGAPTLPVPLAGEVAGIDGLGSSGAGPASPASTLDRRTAPEPRPSDLAQFVRGNERDGADWYVGSDFTQAYGATRLFPGSGSVAGATYPRGVAIATLLASGYDSSTGATLPPWTPSVVDDYFNDTLAPSWPHPNVTGVPVTISPAPAPPSPGPMVGAVDSTGFTIENSLDLEMAGSLAPGSSLYNFYFSGELAVNASTASFAPEYLADDLGAALAYNYSSAELAVVSCSFGLEDLVDDQWNAELVTAAAMGVTVLAASGDQGDAPSTLTGRPDGPWPLWPATVAYNTSGVVSVGGVTVGLAGTPTSTYTSPPLQAPYDPHVLGFANVSAWWNTSGGPGTYSGSEGGTSMTYAEPSWQFHSAAEPPIVAATEVEGFGQLGRAGPDVAFPANSTIAYVAEAANGTPECIVLGGTSVSAPVFAGLIADIVAVENATAGPVHGLGYLDPELYRIGSYYQAYPGGSNPFLDVVQGSNALFAAGPGWDATTGWGGLNASLFLAADRNLSVAGYLYRGPTPGLPAGTPPLTPFEVAALLVAAAAVVLAASVVISRRSGRAPRTYPPVVAYGGAVRAPAPARSTTGPVATFSCPYCGAERPAEPVRCPSCGAM